MASSFLAVKRELKKLPPRIKPKVDIVEAFELYAASRVTSGRADRQAAKAWKAPFVRYTRNGSSAIAKAVGIAGAAVETIAARDPKTKRTTGATDGPKSLKGFSSAIALRRQLTARRLAGCCRVDARFTLASGPRPLDAGLWTLVPSDTGRHRHWSLSALVVFRLGTVRETRSINQRHSNSRYNE